MITEWEYMKAHSRQKLDNTGTNTCIPIQTYHPVSKKIMGTHTQETTPPAALPIPSFGMIVYPPALCDGVANRYPILFQFR